MGSIKLSTDPNNWIKDMWYLRVLVDEDERIWL